jgi:hypothetical protein
MVRKENGTTDGAKTDGVDKTKKEVEDKRKRRMIVREIQKQSVKLRKWEPEISVQEGKYIFIFIFFFFI